MQTSGAGFRRRLIAPTLALWLAAIAVDAATPPESPQFQALPLERSKQNHFLLRARINGKPALLAVDSGAPVSGIALSRKTHFEIAPLPKDSDLPPELRINGGRNRVGIAHRLEIGSITLVDEPVVVIDLKGSTRAAAEFDEQELDGIIGTDILFPTEAVLDCYQQILYMKVDPDAHGPIPGIDHHGWESVPIKVSRGWNLYVDSKLNGKSALLMIDTGAFMTLIHSRFLESMHLDLQDTEYQSGGVNLDDRPLQTTSIKRFSIGHLLFGRFLVSNFSVRGKDVAVMDLGGLMQESVSGNHPPFAGLLGSEFLRRNHGIIDFGTRTLYLKL